MNTRYLEYLYYMYQTVANIENFSQPLLPRYSDQQLQLHLRVKKRDAHSLTQNSGSGLRMAKDYGHAHVFTTLLAVGIEV